MNKHLTLFAISLLAATAAVAEITIDTVFVGNAGNANDTTGFGGVDYNYYIGSYPVTHTQYAAFLNAVAASGEPFPDDMGQWLWTPGLNWIGRSGSDGSYTYSVLTATSGFNEGQCMGNMPVVGLTFWSAARFANWLTTGDTETGVYVLTPEGMLNNTITRDEAAWANGGVAIASENEWYKAAYYDPTLNSGAGGYWNYPTQSNAIPTGTTPNNTNANSANYQGAVGTITEVGAYELASSFYGTFDQGGNVWEWNDEIVSINHRGMRGGWYDSGGLDQHLTRSHRNSRNPSSLSIIGDNGFRVSSLAPISGASSTATVVTPQTFTYPADLVLIDSAVTGTGDTFYSVPAGVTDPTLTVQPFAGNPSNLISFTVTYDLIYDVMHQNGPNGGGFTASAGGDIFMDNVSFTGAGNGTGGGGPPDDILSSSFSIVLSNTYLVADAGITYDPALLDFVTGAAPFDLRYEHSASIAPEADAVSFRLSIREGSTISMTYTAFSEPAIADIQRSEGHILLTLSGSENELPFIIEETSDLVSGIWTTTQVVEVQLESIVLTNAIVTPYRFWRIRWE